ncbi:cytochrome b6-f complex iron-sulfur subunit, chloroplastic [Ziziphus jujuba]|uniref:Cytochrome b6-f complex iron-sulfur subunit, chloroplastic n=1 Tax=Ziziphus jujuba TaxID=326968 RepID=A0A6P4A5V8_ZIZJJ|nr:cytochrome b6-f complex iron-sulfur subunit, chloroplastic [Ziziphus jujuba]
MASSSAILSPSIPLQLCLWKSENALVMKPRWAGNGKRKGKGMRITCQAMTAMMDDKVPDMGKRQLMNLILLGTISLPSAGMVVPYASFFVPHGEGEFVSLWTSK